MTTTNHCPDKPARIFITTKIETEIHDFATEIADRISEFAEDQSMELTHIHDSIINNWADCPRCESLICQTQESALELVYKRINEILDKG